jgi:integrase
MERLQWRDIDLDEGMIDLPANITKRGRRRSIPIEPALKAWLQKHIELCGRQQGRVCKWGTVQLRRNREKLCRRAGISWQQNWARHSYASYWLAKHGDLNKLALHMGHTGGLEVLHRHSNRCVRQADAETYWDITPPSEEDEATQEKAA